MISGKVYDPETKRLLPSPPFIDPLARKCNDLASVSSTFHQLPRSGGLLDQDALTVLGMMFALEAQQKKRELENKNRNPSGSNR